MADDDHDDREDPQQVREAVAVGGGELVDPLGR